MRAIEARRELEAAIRRLKQSTRLYRERLSVLNRDESG